MGPYRHKGGGLMLGILQGLPGPFGVQSPGEDDTPDVRSPQTAADAPQTTSNPPGLPQPLGEDDG